MWVSFIYVKFIYAQFDVNIHLIGDAANLLI